MADTGTTQSYLTAEARARVEIDRQLEGAGWVVQLANKANLGAGAGVAVREFVLQKPHGRADYLLFVDRVPVGAIEAKPEGTTLTEVERQSSKYSEGLPETISAPVVPLPFVYEATGAETRFTNLKDPEPRSRRVYSFHRPETLRVWIRDMVERPEDPTLRARLRQMPALMEGDLWKVQATAIRNIEESLHDDRPRALVQMATGSGKTYTAANLSYRLVRYADARRVLFLVDRGNLGRQTERECQGFSIAETGRKLTQEYVVQRLQANRIDPAARVCISTIQRMYSILRGDAEMDDELDNESADHVAPERPVEIAYNAEVPPETFDVVIIDECHRSIYTVWRQVVEYFDAHLIGLTATPTNNTFGFFDKNLVMEYGHDRAVVDGVNVDYTVYKIRTEITKQGSTIEVGDLAGYRNRQTRALRWELADESATYAAGDLDRKVVAKDQIRTVIRTFRDRLFTDIFPGRSTVPKTLIFAKDDSHADDIVQVVREEFGKGNDFAQKITYRTTDGNPENLLAAFRNSMNPRVVVTVDMIATGTDVKPIECVVFMRDVKSRTYFEQMVGRGVRVMDDTDFQSVTPDAKTKERFVVVDAVGVTESRFADSTQPLERNPTVPLEKILKSLSFGADVPSDLASSLASRLLRLDRQIRPEDRERLQALAKGTSLHDLAGAIVDALDPDRHEAAASAETASPSEEDVAGAGRELLRTALQPLADNPELRNEIIEVRRSLEQTIDEVSIDEVLEASYSVEARAQAAALAGDFRRFIEEHRDEIEALQVLYSRPYKERLTFAQVRELAAVLGRPPRNWTPEKLWRAYDALDHSKVHGSGERMLTDIVSLVRYALEQDAELVPFGDSVGRRFDSWLVMQEQQGVTFTSDQRQWLGWMRDVVATDLGLSSESFEYAPFSAHGGLVRASEVFGARLGLLMDDLTKALAA
ncbi:MAG TPA: restriction endonuclease subunit R [Chloroflexi bacterium]|nr:restriction endonuclease subunit R [Chloroflexota bacterium]